MRIRLALTFALLTFSCRSANPDDAAPQGKPIQWTSAGMTWRPAPPSLPAGARTAVLEGDPKAPGIFTMRIEVPEGARLPPHTHPRPERVTVLSGAVGVGFGKKFDDAGLTVFHSGDYYVNPPGVAHFVAFAEKSVVQITGEGPWELNLVE